MDSKYHHIAIALAGIAQSAILIPQLANSGICNTTLYERSIRSVFITSPKTTLEVYGDISNIKIGLQTLIELLSSGQKEQMEIMRYIFSSLNITNKLLKKHDSLSKISQRLTHITSLYPDLNDEIIGSSIEDLSYSLAGIYSDIVSPISTKIQITGKAKFLQNAFVQAKVRTALLGCIRSAILWYQVGGSRLQFLFHRKRICDAAQQLLQTMNTAY
ncbi:high frequency lysogenization protein HflD [Gilliamella sp. B2776]|uniref:high frequency lysogenization protein HflD n=1 Tax=unclassified Gilliamella TaxID=2685620 RepID=UPI00226A98DF|nr:MULTISPECIES: high frequency lysogenization protein HflD [unclassified Gilliamella]MCX8650460.1 high frequency lysogenization protein HflD [Gilliamella sp. B2779]MCX8654494.1 high frequency lysogenization protein HflD [Gilliamella sp. B2737]MCX8692308.1 high frequency lysogenization protein HflD [Gilliamella sp. B2776]MCX8703490.1 high frequency lysogenization protein HflD [Gilliamella sp. B2781]WDM18925.1 high frequency lysogenization protein HflD [Gilliamella sp. B3022]